MLLAEDRLPDHDDLTTIRNLPSVLGQITSLTECTASEDLGYTILHCINSLPNEDKANSTRGGNVRTARPGAGAEAGRGIVGPIRSLAREFM